MILQVSWHNYCWWFRNPAITTWWVVHPIISNVFYIPGSCLGVLPSTVIVSSHPSKYYFFWGPHCRHEFWTPMSIFRTTYRPISMYFNLPHFSVAMFSKLSGKLHGPENNSSPLKMIQARKGHCIFQPFLFRGKVSLSFRLGYPPWN